jgi:hypothetical protein
MSAVTSVSMLATAAITEHIQNPKMRMGCLVACAALISVIRETMWQHRVSQQVGGERGSKTLTRV